MKKTMILLGFLALAPFAKGQLLLEALEGGIPFTPSEKCLERVKDKYYGDGIHNFVYCAVQGPNGKKWLNLNLGAEYAREGSEHFNPEAVPDSWNDWKASGSLFQYGRKADGHEIVTYNQGRDFWEIKRMFPIIDTPVDPINSPNNYVKSKRWDNASKSTRELGSLWNNENNPCPNNYRIMTVEDVKSFTEPSELTMSYGNLQTMASLKNSIAKNLSLFLGAAVGVLFDTTTSSQVPNSSALYGTSGLWLTYNEMYPQYYDARGNWISIYNRDREVYYIDLGYRVSGTSTTAPGLTDNTIYRLGISNSEDSGNSLPIRCVER